MVDAGWNFGSRKVGGLMTQESSLQMNPPKSAAFSKDPADHRSTQIGRFADCWPVVGRSQADGWPISGWSSNSVTWRWMVATCQFFKQIHIANIAWRISYFLIFTGFASYNIRSQIRWFLSLMGRGSLSLKPWTTRLFTLKIPKCVVLSDGACSVFFNRNLE